MPLIICTECGNKISDRAQMCVYCGCPIEEIKKDIEINSRNRLFNEYDIKFKKMTLKNHCGFKELLEQGISAGYFDMPGDKWNNIVRSKRLEIESKTLNCSLGFTYDRYDAYYFDVNHCKIVVGNEAKDVMSILSPNMILPLEAFCEADRQLLKYADSHNNISKAIDNLRTCNEVEREIENERIKEEEAQEKRENEERKKRIKAHINEIIRLTLSRDIEWYLSSCKIEGKNKHYIFTTNYNDVDYSMDMVEQLYNYRERVKVFTNISFAFENVKATAKVNDRLFVFLVDYTWKNNKYPNYKQIVSPNKRNNKDWKNLRFYYAGKSYSINEIYNINEEYLRQELDKQGFTRKEIWDIAYKLEQEKLVTIDDLFEIKKGVFLSKTRLWNDLEYKSHLERYNYDYLARLLITESFRIIDEQSEIAEENWRIIEALNWTENKKDFLDHIKRSFDMSKIPKIILDFNNWDRPFTNDASYKSAYSDHVTRIELNNFIKNNEELSSVVTDHYKDIEDAISFRIFCNLDKHVKRMLREEKSRYQTKYVEDTRKTYRYDSNGFQIIE